MASYVMCLVIILYSQAASVDIATPITPHNQTPFYECEAEWISRPGDPTCYKMNYRASSYESAVQTCSSMAAQLITIETEEENQYISDQISFKFTAYIAIQRQNGQWTWPIAEKVDFDNWAKVQPIEKECTYLSRTGKWLSVRCNSLFESLAIEYICEHSLEESLNCTDEWHEYSVASNISCYKIFPIIFTNSYSIIARACPRSGGDLVSIETFAENQFLNSMLGKYRNAIIGLKHENGIWQWPTGAKAVLDNWETGEPKIYDCATISWDGLWRQALCQQSQKVAMFICEKAALEVFLVHEEITTPISFHHVSNTVISLNDEEITTPMPFQHGSNTQEDSMSVLYIALPLGVVVLITTVCIVWRLCICRHKLQSPENRNEIVQLSVILKSVLEDEVKMKLNGLLVPRSTVDVQELLGQGAFGLVYRGTYMSGDVHDIQTVAIKTLKTNCTATQMSGLAEEAATMSNFEHMHILSILGMCIRQEDGVPMLILPYMDNGDLRTYLRKFSSAKQENVAPDEKQLVTFCLHIARGMEYLAEQKFVHRDLAARNCMLDTQLIVKIADFGLSRDIYTSSYYRLDQQKCLPVKWLSLESLRYQTFTVHSDVWSVGLPIPEILMTWRVLLCSQWSFGVTMWEIVTLGMMPYVTVENIAMKQHLQSGARLERPDNCSHSMFELMLSCWDDTPEERPPFSDISTILADEVAGMSGYFELHVDSNNEAHAPNDEESREEPITADFELDTTDVRVNIHDSSDIAEPELTTAEPTTHRSPEHKDQFSIPAPAQESESHILNAYTK